MELSRGKIIVEKKINEHTIDEDVFLFEPCEEDIYDKNNNLRYIFHNTFIRTEEEIMISEFKKYCKNKCLKINKSFFENECLRYLYSAQFDFSKAFDLIKNNYEFRLSDILPINERDIIEYINKGIMYWHGRDKKCRPIIIINLLNIELLDIQKLTNLFFFCFEFFLKYLCIPGKVENYISLIDCSGISISKFPMSTFMRLLEIMNSKYRCRLFRMYIIDAPKIFKSFGKSFLNFAPSYMTKKLKILDGNYSSYLREEILETQLEKKYGGIQENKDNAYYPFSFYSNCYSTEKNEKSSKNNSILIDIFSKMDHQIYDHIASGYSMHLKLIELGEKESIRQKYDYLKEKIYYEESGEKNKNKSINDPPDNEGTNTYSRTSTNNISSQKSSQTYKTLKKKKSKKLNLSTQDSFINNNFINCIINKKYYIDSANINFNNLMKSHKYINCKSKYIVNIASLHKWFFKVKNLYLSNIVSNYLTNKFPFLIDHIVNRSNYKSLCEYIKYIDQISANKKTAYTTKGSIQNNSKIINSLSCSDKKFDNPNDFINASTSNTISSNKDTQENTNATVTTAHSINSCDETNDKANCNKREIISHGRPSNVHPKNKSGIHNGHNFKMNSSKKICNSRDMKNKIVYRTESTNEKIQFYCDSASIFEENAQILLNDKDNSSNRRNKYQNNITTNAKNDRKKKHYKITAANSIFKDEIPEQKLEGSHNKNDKISGKSNINLEKSDKNNNTNISNNINHSYKKKYTKDINDVNVITKKGSNTSYDKTLDKKGSIIKKDDTPIFYCENREHFEKNVAFQNLSDFNKHIQNNNDPQKNIKKKSKKIKIIGLNFFNKTSPTT
ncbi:Sec14 protein, putative [Plasmodium berghei]|uniref:CRAL/TRIO domain-containing protein, putative n=2 Tax=Plasmodium berghei TaxID=5821 RepID=A0A509AMB6_PLABA|nr:CRAL/TRIO domain-containing protein, putative [Plasmodium berghei ANKA]CXI65134.1 Sec14 protein, putative [Plasmodium berghei]SCM23928.1 Sec14 protein, putative [Plasmodium berghei]SCN26842.1 Sec14 protein, putative [Plasmodium berghei]SCO61221.1 Sec14 protein, putative [Plasmodium berghei]SCO63262.1 Sec14 protein, putative [Plasmodium berghei]|eukprot:XP_034422459.1 CRAL/TRIO domain-containing protein, putative [Plasmodium berghei ANKA]